MAQFSECGYTRWSHDLGILRPDDRLVTPERSTSHATHGCETTPTRGEEPPEPRVSRWAIESSPSESISASPEVQIPAASLLFPAQCAGSMKQAPDLLQYHAPSKQGEPVIASRVGRVRLHCASSFTMAASRATLDAHSLTVMRKQSTSDVESLLRLLIGSKVSS
ncbi:hypothetical protein XANCAGTX0491_003529 [Xanthoria calcicola]